MSALLDSAVTSKRGRVVEVRHRTLVGGGTAATTTFTPAGNIAATNVQAAIGELDTEKVAKAGDTLAGTLTTQLLQPDGDGTRDLGTTSARYRVLLAQQARVVSGNGTVTLSSTANAFGRANNSGGGGGAAELRADGVGAVVCATVTKTAAGTHYVRAAASGTGSVVSGVVTDYYAVAATVTASGDGSSFSGVCSGYSAAATVTASGAGASVFGDIVGVAAAANVTASGNGAFFTGFVSGSTVTIGGAGGAFIGSADNGATVTSGTISVHRGTVVGGAAAGAGAALSATGDGAVVFASVTAGQTASATAGNAAQFGVGTNAQPDSLGVGTTMRLKGTTGSPSVPRDGDLWVDTTGGNHIRMRSAGVNQIFNRPTVTGSRATGDALASLLTQLATMNLVVDSTTA